MPHLIHKLADRCPDNQIEDICQMSTASIETPLHSPDSSHNNRKDSGFDGPYSAAFHGIFLLVFILNERTLVFRSHQFGLQLHRR